jgi:flagellar biosynthesis protein FlhB
MADDQEKTEEATPERRKRARDEGQFARGKDSGNTLGSLAVLLAVVGFSDRLTKLLADFSWQCFHEPFVFVGGDARAFVSLMGAVLAALVVPFALAAAIGSTAAIQTWIWQRPSGTDWSPWANSRTCFRSNRRVHRSQSSCCG